MNDMLNPANPLSPLSPVHPLNTEVVAPLPRQGIKIDMTVNWLTWALLGIAALILAGAWVKRRRDRRKLRKAWSDFKDEIVANRTVAKKPDKKPECQSCQNFISCSMAGVTRCPLL